LDTLLVAAVAIIVGLVVAGFGTRMFYILLPLWGFLTGFIVGADLVASIAGEGIFASLGGWLAGAGLGLLFAALAGLWFYGAVLVLGAGLGVTVASGLLAAFGIDGGLLTLLAGVAAGVAVGVVVILTDAPSVLVAAITGYAGATWVVVGVMLLIGRIKVADLHGVGAGGALRGDVPALAIAFALGTLAFGYQVLDLRSRRIDELRRDGYRL
jgi:hypothetical protein